MNTLKLHIGQTIQGEFKLKKLNVMLVFQVNCPGCFSYALPMFNTLYHTFKSNQISFLGVSTAFEDFDKNTVTHTQELITQGKLVGETKRYMSKYDINLLPYTIDFPIVMDLIEDKVSRIDLAVDAICETNPNVKIWPEFEKANLRTKIISYLNQLEKVPLTFTLNQLQGTPSFIIFNDSYDILYQAFGYVNREEIADKIAQFNSDYDL